MGHYDSDYEHESRRRAAEYRAALIREYEKAREAFIPSEASNQELELLAWALKHRTTLLGLRQGLNGLRHLE